MGLLSLKRPLCGSILPATSGAFSIFRVRCGKPPEKPNIGHSGAMPGHVQTLSAESLEFRSVTSCAWPLIAQNTSTMFGWEKPEDHGSRTNPGRPRPGLHTLYTQDVADCEKSHDGAGLLHTILLC